MKKIELLAPAGNFEALVAAVESGADAIYLGGSKFNARASADNFDEAALAKAVEYAHIRGVKIYVTVNILIFDKEISDVLEYIRYLYEIGVDALIVQDYALILMVRNLFPDFELHCSTQMTIHNLEGAKHLAELGAKRIVLARELMLEEAAYIAAQAGVEVEVFVHGALCVSYSGQCYMSSMIGGRSGNRGRCAQPCRKRYSFVDLNTHKTLSDYAGKHLLSTKDLNTYDRLEEIIHSGVTSLKIEGRMKRPEYVAIVVKNYREAIDNLVKGKKQPSNEAQVELLNSFNREFTEGYLFGNRNRQIVSIDRPDNRGVHVGQVIRQNGNNVFIEVNDHPLSDGDGIEIIGHTKSIGCAISGLRVDGKAVSTAQKGDTALIYVRDKVEQNAIVNKTFDSLLNKKAKEEYYYENRRKIALKCHIELRKGKKPIVSVSDELANQVNFTGTDIIVSAEKTASTADKIKEQLQKTGDTPYRFEQIEVLMDSDIYVPVKTVNELRREVLSRMSKKRADNQRCIAHFNSSAIVDYFSQKRNELKNNDIEYIAGIRQLSSAEAAAKAGINNLAILSGIYSGNLLKEAAAIISLCKAKNINLIYIMPSITRETEFAWHRTAIESFITAIKRQQAEIKIDISVSNIGQINFAKLLNINALRANYSMNIFNSISANYFYKLGIQTLCLSPELNLPQIKEIAINCPCTIEAIVYGYFPVMNTEYCPISLLSNEISEEKNCSAKCKSTNYGIIDEKGKIFPIIQQGNCRSQLLNSDPIHMLDDLSKIKASGISRLRMDFYIEKDEDVFNIIKAYMHHGISNNEDAEGIYKGIKPQSYTKGHYFRGVE